MPDSRLLQALQDLRKLALERKGLEVKFAKLTAAMQAIQTAQVRDPDLHLSPRAFARWRAAAISFFFVVGRGRGVARTSCSVPPAILTRP